MFTRLIERYAELVVRRRVAVAVAVLCVTAFLASRIGSLRLDNEPDLWAPQNHEFVKTTHELERLFGGRNFTVIGVVPRRGDIFQPEVLAKVQRIQAGIEAMPEAIRSNVTSVAARRVKDVRATDDGIAVTPMLESVPATAEELDVLRRAMAANPIYSDSLYAADRTALAVVADFNLPAGESSYTSLAGRIRAIAERERDADVDIVYGGVPIESAHFETSMAKMPLYFGAAFLIVMGIQYLAFRSLQGTLLPMVTAILSVVWGLGLMALMGIDMDALNTTTPILIMAVATGHAVQVLKRYYEELEVLALPEDKAARAEVNRRAVAVSLTRVAPVMLTAAAVAAFAFFSLTLSDVALIRHFGVFAGAGILAILTIELTFIPAVRAMLPAGRPPRRAAEGPLDRALLALGERLASPRVSVAVLAGAGLILGVATLGALQLKADNSVKKYSRADSVVRVDGRVLDQKFGGTDALLFLVDGGGPDGLKNPDLLKAIDKLQRFLDAQPHVGKTQSLVDLVKRMNRAMHRDDPAYDVVPDDRNLIAQYLLLFSSSGDPEDLANLVDADYGKAVVWVVLKTDSTAYAQSLYQKAQEVIAESFPPGTTVRLGGGLAQTVAINASLTETKVKNMAQMAVVVFLLSSLALESFVGGLLVVIPLGAIVLANLGIMGWLGVPLDMGSATTTAMVTGIGADYEIYMLYRLREEYRRCRDLKRAMQASLLTSGKAVLYVALSIAGGYASLMVSDFGFYSRLSITMMTTMIISALLSLILLRAVITVFKPRLITGEPRVAPAAGARPLVLEEQ